MVAHLHYWHQAVEILGFYMEYSHLFKWTEHVVRTWQLLEIGTLDKD